MFLILLQTIIKNNNKIYWKEIIDYYECRTNNKGEE